MKPSLMGRILCWIGIHKWGPWQRTWRTEFEPKFWIAACRRPECWQVKWVEETW